MQNYAKPSVTDLGTLRQLTQIGQNPDCDGGIFGIGNGSTILCSRSS
jgi:hypothetical protein